MSIGSLGIVSSAAGAPLAQAHGADVEKNREAQAARERHARTETSAADAAGIGRADGENQQPNDRDADGRMPYTYDFERPPAANADEPAVAEAPPPAADPSGESGSRLDLSG